MKRGMRFRVKIWYLRDGRRMRASCDVISPNVSLAIRAGVSSLGVPDDTIVGIHASGPKHQPTASRG